MHPHLELRLVLFLAQWIHSKKTTKKQSLESTQSQDQASMKILENTQYQDQDGMNLKKSIQYEEELAGILKSQYTIY